MLQLEHVASPLRVRSAARQRGLRLPAGLPFLPACPALQPLIAVCACGKQLPSRPASGQPCCSVRSIWIPALGWIPLGWIPALLDPCTRCPNVPQHPPAVTPVQWSVWYVSGRGLASGPLDARDWVSVLGEMPRGRRCPRLSRGTGVAWTPSSPQAASAAGAPLQGRLGRMCSCAAGARRCRRRHRHCWSLIAGVTLAQFGGCLCRQRCRAAALLTCTSGERRTRTRRSGSLAC
mmetsp:Transcript_30611/g.76818  ORF Transcript_30611/g.76818 Transcript_30611/m.76818 type:complete len:234 (+) Transcript_30611:31-732(+)